MMFRPVAWIAIGWLFGTASVVSIIALEDKDVVVEPVVCVVQMNSRANNQTHNFKGVVK